VRSGKGSNLGSDVPLIFEVLKILGVFVFKVGRLSVD
jgi:hypothetical protein